MLLFEIIWKRHTAINQLVDGLKNKDVLTLLRKHPETFKDKFVSSSVLLTHEILLKDMIFTLPGKELEEKAQTFLIEYLKLDGEISVGDGRCKTFIPTRKAPYRNVDTYSTTMFSTVPYPNDRS